MAAAIQLSFVVCLIAATASIGKAQTSTDAATTTVVATTTAVASAATTTAPGGSTAAPGSTVTPGTGPTNAPAGSTAAPGTGATAAATTQSAEIACLSCNGTDDSSDPCMTAASSFSTTINCATQAGCWVYREDDAGNVTISRGCGRSDLNDGECTSQKEDEQCDTSNTNNINVCRRCCTTASCNHAGLTLTGSVGTPTAYVSTVVIVTSFITAVFCNDLRF
ncbi:mucin-19-like [Branchiostoma floridae]|uniref:Mucin-19-like n=1 Tax=Branchiostoma floridae TaxID=7739 RepID=A0A9J7M8E3_BRAFL|nr:mucin-19-like [Branchiostoma floridae]